MLNQIGLNRKQKIEKNAGRIKALHFKDFTEMISRDKCMEYICAVGEGTLPLNKIAEAAKKYPLYEGGLVMDQDTSLDDILHDAGVGIKNLNKVFAV